MRRALVVFSGGQDSTTCLGWAKNHFDEVETITFDYGQKHRIEIAQAAKIARIFTIYIICLYANFCNISNAHGNLLLRVSIE